MAADPSLVQTWKRRAEPFQTVVAGYPPSWYVQRQGRSVAGLVDEVTDPLSSGPERWPHVVLVGNRGSGKTFHLRRVVDELAKRGGWFPVFLDLERTFEAQSLRTGAIDALQSWELVLLAAAAVHGAIPSWHSAPSLDEQREVIQREGAALLAGETKDAPQLDLGKLAAGLVGLAIQLTTGAPVAGPVQQVLSGSTKWTVPLAGGTPVAEDDPRARRLVEATSHLLRQASAHLGRQVVLVLDGVDRASAEDESTTRRLLVSDTALARLDCPVICTAGPIWYRFNTSPEVRPWRTEELVNITVASRTQPWKVLPDGVAFFRDLCGTRLEAEEVEQVLDAGALELVAYYSGGVVRDFVRMTHRAMAFALREGVARVTRGHAMEVVAEAERELDPGWTSTDTAIVEAVLRRPSEAPDHPGLARAVTRQIIRPYRNGVFWWGLNPLLHRHRFRPPDGHEPPGG